MLDMAALRTATNHNIGLKYLYKFEDLNSENLGQVQSWKAEF